MTNKDKINLTEFFIAIIFDYGLGAVLPTISQNQTHKRTSKVFATKHYRKIDVPNAIN
jgi:hypothetical protein